MLNPRAAALPRREPGTNLHRCLLRTKENETMREKIVQAVVIVWRRKSTDQLYACCRNEYLEAEGGRIRRCAAAKAKKKTIPPARNSWKPMWWDWEETSGGGDQNAGDVVTVVMMVQVQIQVQACV